MHLKVIKRAEQIRSRWRDIPTVTSIRAKSAGPAGKTIEADAAAEPDAEAPAQDDSGEEVTP